MSKEEQELSDAVNAALTFEFPTPEEAAGFASIVRISSDAAKRTHRVVDVSQCSDHERVRRIAKQFSGTEVK